MSRKSMRKLQLFFVAVMMTTVSLACTEVTREPDAQIHDLMEEADKQGIESGYTREDELQFFEDVEGERSYSVVETFYDERSGCDPGYPLGDKVPIGLDHTAGTQPSEDVIIIAGKDGPRKYTRLSEDEPFLFCRTYPFVHGDGQTYDRLECVRFTTSWKYQLVVYYGGRMTDEYLCYLSTYEANPEVAADDQKPEEEEKETKSEEEEEEPKPEEQTGSQGLAFTVDDCDCSGVDAPLASSWASKKPGMFGSSAGTDFENVERLDCRWIEEYRSERKTAEIWLDLEIYKLNSAQDAQTLFAEFRDDRSKRLPDCEEDDDCTVAIADFAPERAFYVENQAFIRGDGVQFPALHEAYLSRLITTAGGDSFVLHIWVSHPERELGDSWVVDVSETLEACAVAVADR